LLSSSSLIAVIAPAAANAAVAFFASTVAAELPKKEA
jgi:hypothetical protein